MKKVIYTDMLKAMEAVENGYVLQCPKCGADLVYVFSAEAARKTKMHPGVYCPNSRDQLTVTMNIENSKIDEMWAELEKRKVEHKKVTLSM
ncbi:MAG TPA: hypothetical protein DCW74_16880 [Alteromonas australica]|uniref:Uncharacterized protein n=1 Tax=Alteromonas australica TaxID=589873 RepID=A0A350P7X7_9ALTE|nr:hypothetical protein [Alteromonas australica]